MLLSLMCVVLGSLLISFFGTRDEPCGCSRSPVLHGPSPRGAALARRWVAGAGATAPLDAINRAAHEHATIGLLRLPRTCWRAVAREAFNLV